MIEYRRDPRVDRYEVFLQVRILACDRTALFRDMRPSDVFTAGNFIPPGIFDAFGSIWPVFAAPDSHISSFSFRSVRRSI